MIKRLKIKGLYGHYNYDIMFNATQRIKILIGPNGYGKTTILKIMYHIMNRDYWYFNLLIFRDIIVEFDNSVKVHIYKTCGEPDLFGTTGNGDITESCFCLIDERENNDGIVNTFILSKNYILRKLRRATSAYRTIDSMQNIDFEDILNRNYVFAEDEFLPEGHKTLSDFLQTQKCLFVKEQRVQYEGLDSRYERYVVNKYNVDKIAGDLKAILSYYQNAYIEKCQKIDSEFVGKLLSLDDKDKNLDKRSYEKFVDQLKGILETYQEYGLATDLKIDYRYDERYGTVLYQYISDMIDKINAYKELWLRLSSFDKVLKSKEFANKQMKINAKEGLVAQDMDTKSPIPLHKLSSGEQNLIILYFYLLFKTTPDMTICLDEPENSLHVAWQETMLTDLRTIADVLKLQIIVATHSVDFVNGNWDDCFDLFEGMKKNVNEL